MKELMTIQTKDGICSGIRDGFALLDLARGWLKQGIPAVAIELLESAINSAEAERDERLRARILKETGRAMMMQSDWANSESHYLEAQRGVRKKPRKHELPEREISRGRRPV